jgi:hypothetical protein
MATLRVSGLTHLPSSAHWSTRMSRAHPIRTRNQFKRWLLYILDLPTTATYAEIRAALERRLGIAP